MTIKFNKRNNDSFNYDEKYTNWAVFNPDKTFNWLCIAVSIITILFGLLLIFYVFSHNLRGMDLKQLSIFLLLEFLTYVMTVIIHEFMHLIIYPCKLSSDKLIINIRINNLYSFYNGVMKKSRLIISLLFPIISMLLLSLIIIFYIDNTQLNNFLIFSIAFNIMASQRDISVALYLFAKLPKNTIVYADKYYIVQADEK